MNWFQFKINPLVTHPYVGAYISYLCCLSLKFGNSKFNADHIDLEAILT